MYIVSVFARVARKKGRREKEERKQGKMELKEGERGGSCSSKRGKKKERKKIRNIWEGRKLEMKEKKQGRRYEEGN